MFKQITIIGFGLLGSSIAHAIKEQNLSSKIICVDSNQLYCDKVLSMGLADEATINAAAGVQGSELIIICTPVGAMGRIAREIAGSLNEGAIVTDVGSVKKAVIKDMQHHLPSNIHFVPGHPIAGTAESGPESGFASLFHERWCILTPLEHTELRPIEKLTKFWEACGCNIEIMDAERHDLILGITSHLPHLIAYTIVGTATELEDDIKSDVIKFSASGFRDFTRIAASDPTMWRDVFLNNKDSVLEVLQRFTEDLTGLQKAIRKADGDYLYQSFDKTRNIRRAIVDAGQANDIEPEKLKAQMEK